MTIVCGAPNESHDAAFVADLLRAEVAALDPAAVVEVAATYEVARLDTAAALVTYIASRSPDRAASDSVRRFLERGGRWLALHTSSWVDEGSALADVLGSRFITHPPYGPFMVSVDAPGDDLLQGIEPFEVEDELYVVAHASDIEVLLSSPWGGEALQGHQFEVAGRPLMYRRTVGAGGVVYLALGHANAAGAMTGAGAAPERRGSWQSPVFRELVRRGLRWALAGAVV